MSFDIRETRLRNDYGRIRDLVDRSDLIHVRATEGTPPEKYLIQFTCKGVEKVSPSGRPVYRETHEVSVYLHAEYPLKQPQLKWLTPIFHPNIHFNTGEVCLDILKQEWTPAWNLMSVCRAIHSLLAHPEASSPLNCDAGNILRSGDLFAFNSLARYYAIENASADKSISGFLEGC